MIRPRIPFRIVEVEFANFFVPVRERREGKKKERERKKEREKGNERERERKRERKEGDREKIIHREFSCTPVFRKYELQWNECIVAT